MWGSDYYEDMYDPEKERVYEENLRKEREEAIDILKGKVNNVTFTNCMIPLQMHGFLPGGEWIYARNSRVGGDVSLYIFDKEYVLSSHWPDKYERIEITADAWKYTDIARAILEGLEKRNENNYLRHGPI